MSQRKLTAFFLPSFNVNAVHINMQTLKNSKNVTYLMFLFDVY